VRDAFLAVLVFALTWAEVVVCTKGGRADRQSTSCKTSRKSWEAAGWEGAHVVILVAYTYIVIRQSLWFAVPEFVAAILSKRWALEARRRKFRSRTKRKKSRAVAPVPQQGSPPEA
jgi:hypothetical protein